MSRLIVIDSDTCQDPEPEGQEYGNCIFEELPNVSMIKKVSSEVNMTLNEIMVSSVDLSPDLQLGVHMNGCARCNKTILSIKGS